MSKLIILLVFGAILVAGGQVMAQQDVGCVEAKCHDDMGTKKFVHGPVGAKICTVCHTAVEGKKHQFQLAAEKEDLCFACHEEKRDMMLAEHLHTPVADGNCVGCHDPHQSDYRFTLRDEAANLCFECHKKEEFNRSFVHGPVGVGDCNVCHDPHAAENEHQLVQPAETLCFKCHQEQSGMTSKRHVHLPVAESCVNCHNPHSNEAKFLLPSDPPELCYGCHENIAAYSEVEVQHPPVAQGECDKCHDSHSSDNPKMFKQEQVTLCFSCHEELGEYVSEQTHLHGPVKEGDCNACHDPHGSQNYRILRKFFPKEFYMPYDTDNYASCFDCHNKDIALEPKTTAVTDFRNGDENLHFVHVNKEKKGRSCKACHQAHATRQAKHIRSSVPFGSMNWELPVKFTKFDDGGSCEVGCHAPKEYHR